MTETPQAFQLLQAAILELGEAATTFRRNVSAGDTPLALIETEVSAQLVAQAARAAEPVYHTIAAALSQITNSNEQVPLIQQMRELPAAVIEGRPDRVATIQAQVVAAAGDAINRMASQSVRDETPGEAIARLSREIEALEDDNLRRLQALADQGLIPQSYVDYYRRESERIRTLPEGSQERSDATRALADRTDREVRPAADTGNPNAAGIIRDNEGIRDRDDRIRAARDAVDRENTQTWAPEVSDRDRLRAERDRLRAVRGNQEEPTVVTASGDLPPEDLGDMPRVAEAEPVPTTEPVIGRA